MGRSSLFISLLAVSNHVLGANWIGEIKEENGVTYQCKCYQDNSCWPKAADWSALNNTVGGALKVAIPPGAVCHKSFQTFDNVSIATYNAAKCADTQANWLNETWL
jgi:hypothetical protein